MIRLRDVRSDPAYDGAEFGAAGAYEWVFATIDGQVDPRDRRNRGIALIDQAPRNAAGLVEYEADLAVLRPAAAARGNGWLLYDVLNRGTKRAIQRINSGPGTNRPVALADLGTRYLLERGFAVAWSGWQGDVPPGAGRMLARLPTVPLVGTSREEFILDLAAPVREDGIVELSPELFRYTLSYPAADRAAPARLTLRQAERDPRRTPPGLAWRYVDDRTIEVSHPAGLPFDRGAIFEFVYEARDPTVMGLGLAAIRDAVAFLRHGGDGNPLHGRVRRALGFSLSQSGRVLRDLLYEGFNEDLAGRPVFDAVTPLIAGSRRSFLNAPFAQPGRFSRQHEDHSYPGDQFPFAYGEQHDPISGRTDGILTRAIASGVCPKVMHLDTDSEYVSARASLVVTDCTGQDVEQPADVRVYLAASVAHGDYPLPPEIASAPGNTLTYASLIRALIDAMVAWVDTGRPPPPSRHPTRAAGTLLTLAEAAARFPAIPSVGFPTRLNELRLAGADAAYPVFVGRTDADGNGDAGVTHPLVVLPVGTHTGWQLRRAGYAEGALFNVFGSFLPFAATAAERTSDPRPSLAERYGTAAGWRDRLAAALQPLVDQGFLLAADRDRILSKAQEGYPSAMNWL